MGVVIGHLGFRLVMDLYMADHKLPIIGQLLITIIVMPEILAGRYLADC